MHSSVKNQIFIIQADECIMGLWLKRDRNCSIFLSLSLFPAFSFFSLFIVITIYSLKSPIFYFRVGNETFEWGSTKYSFTQSLTHSMIVQVEEFVLGVWPRRERRRPRTRHNQRDTNRCSTHVLFNAGFDYLTLIVMGKILLHSNEGWGHNTSCLCFNFIIGQKYMFFF